MGLCVMRLRHYQHEAIEGVRQLFKTLSSALLVLATGAGKTVVFSSIAKSAAAKGKRVLILAHRDTLIRQASEKLTAYGVDHGIMMPSFTPAPYKLVQVASVQTLVRRLDKIKHKFDLIIIDEAHLSAAKSYMTCIEALAGNKVLGVTGSPCRLDGKGLGRHVGGLFDEMFIGISIKDLIAQGFLVKPAVFAPAERVDLTGIKMVGGDYDTHALADLMDKPKITGSAIAQYQSICPGVPAVAWCANVAHAEHVAAEFNAAGIPALMLSGEASSSDRSKALRDLSSGKIKVITFAMLLVEGVDCPAIGAVILLRPTMSLASLLQVIGRGLRPIYADGMPLDTVDERMAAIDAGPKGRRCFVLDHAGLTFTHGFADEIREWSLDGMRKKKKSKKDAADKDTAIKQCEKCYFVHDPAPECPCCGYVYPVRAAGKPETVDGELKEITEEIRATMEKRRSQGKIQTVEDLIEKLGYSRYRAEAIVAARAEKQNLIDGLTVDLRAWREMTGQSALDTFGVPMSSIKNLKPKQLKDLREKFNAHKAAYCAADPTFTGYLSEALKPQHNLFSGETAGD